MEETARYGPVLAAHQEAVESFFRRHSADVERAAREMAEAVGRGGKILFFGNGGSAADAQHLAAELVNRMTRDRPAIPALALSTDTSVLTSIGNDASYDRVFERQIEALGRKGDVAVALSTSGNSPNILLALTRSRERGLRSVALLGRDGGRAFHLADIPLRVDSTSTARIQEVHILIGHLLCEEVESILHPPVGAG
jgi:D-sedoheptulose 7-phosphate isomerase